MLNQTPQANRLHIAVFGIRNVGKSTLVNAITGQQIALVSETAGTTTDPVYKSMEILPIGPVTIIDTAGLDDAGGLGELRVGRTRKIMDRTDLALLVFSSTPSDFSHERVWYEELRRREIPIIGVINRIDEQDAEVAVWKEHFDIPFVKVSAKHNMNMEDLIAAIQTYAPLDFEKATLIADVVPKNGLVVLVAPPDIQSPKGRIKLVQVQVIRDLLDDHAMSIVVTDNELERLLSILKRDPDLVITDSQAFEKVSRIVPNRVPLTSFSIVLARNKGDLNLMLEGAHALAKLKPGDKVLIAEACSHHALKGDIARERLPRWLEDYVGGKLDVTVNRGIDFPSDLGEYQLILHCGACMFNRRQVMTRLQRAMEAGVPITNFGIAIAYLKGILERSVRVFEAEPSLLAQGFEDK